MNFDPEATFTKDSSLFGMPKSKNSNLHILPAPWEPTTSFKKGALLGPKALFEATKQMDLFHPYFKKVYEKGIYWADEKISEIETLNSKASPLCEKVRLQLEEGQSPDLNSIDLANQISGEFNEVVYQFSQNCLQNKKLPALVGGDHSCPYGLIKALSEHYSSDFSILHIDAHFDLRLAYQGFTHSHASIMYNVLKNLSPQPELYQIGLRDFSESEFKLASKETHFLLDQELHTQMYSGLSFQKVLEGFLKQMKEKIYISFDIDGLAPHFCPHTGTPVPGGLSYNQVCFMIQYLHKKGHKLIGFDLVEVSPGKTEPLGEGVDEIIGSRLLYELSCFALS